MKSYIGCICLTWLHCVFSNVSSKYLDQRRYNQIVCIGFAFLHCAFSCASSGFLFDTMHTCTGYLSFAHCSFPKASSKYLDQIMQNHKCKKTAFWPPKGQFWPFEASLQPAMRSFGHLPENQSYPELPHDVGKLWSHWVGSIGAQKWGLHGTKRIEFLAQNLHFLDPIGLTWARIWPIF